MNKKGLIYALLASLTLGLAPFTPEPHIWQKLKWLANGGNGMKTMDYFDVFLHGTPWLVLIYFSVCFIKDLRTNS